MSVIPQTPRAYGGGGFVSLDPLLGLFPGPDGDLKRSPDPSPTHAPPPIPNPGSTPGMDMDTYKLNSGKRDENEENTRANTFDLEKNPTQVKHRNWMRKKYVQVGIIMTNFQKHTRYQKKSQ